MEMRGVFRSFHTGDFFFPVMEKLLICHILFPFLLSIAVSANCSSSFIHWKKPKHTRSELGVYKNTHPCPLLLNEGNSRLERSSPSPSDSKLCIEVSLTVCDQCLSTSCTTRTSSRVGDGLIGEQAHVSSIGLRPGNQVLSLKIHVLALVTLSWVGWTGLG